MGKILIVGDVHGNYPKLIDALKNADYDEINDIIIFVGDLMDRGCHNARVARFVAKCKGRIHIIQGNHELQHKNMLMYYHAILSYGKEYAAMVSDIFRYFNQDSTWPVTKEACGQYKCSLEERQKIIQEPVHDFESAIRRIIVFTLAWDDINPWQIIATILETMCGDPYNAEHTLYEYFSATDKTREAMENIWTQSRSPINLNLPNEKFTKIVISHNNPFGNSIYCTDPDAEKDGHKNTLYLFGHIPVKQITTFDEKRGQCRYIDLDLSPKQVGIFTIQT